MRLHERRTSPYPALTHGSPFSSRPTNGAEADSRGQVAGYTVADYLLQHASGERRAVRVPASTWDALLSHIRDPDDAARLADSAESRLLYRYAIQLCRPAADADDRHAALRLAQLLAERGDLDQLRARAGERTFWGRLRRRGADPHRSTAMTSPADARAWAEVAGTKLSGGA